MQLRSKIRKADIKFPSTIRSIGFGEDEKAFINLSDNDKILINETELTTVKNVQNSSIYMYYNSESSTARMSVEGVRNFNTPTNGYWSNSTTAQTPKPNKYGIITSTVPDGHFYQTFHKWCLNLTKYIYHLSVWCILMDTHLLQKRSNRISGRNFNNSKFLIWMILLPLILVLGTVFFSTLYGSLSQFLLNTNQFTSTSSTESIIDTKRIQDLEMTINQLTERISQLESTKTNQIQTESPLRIDEMDRKLNQTIYNLTNLYYNEKSLFTMDLWRISEMIQRLEWKLNRCCRSNAFVRKEIHELEQQFVLLNYKIPIDVKTEKVEEGNGQKADDILVAKIVEATLEKYDADRTGLPDFAMEAMGAQIVSTRCTETYTNGTSYLSLFGIPLWYNTISPSVAIRAGAQPGECWPFQNFPGFLVIKLAKPIYVDAFSMEHISKKLVPNGCIDSAPKLFEVYGLNASNDPHPFKFGSYTYNAKGQPVQYFTALNTAPQRFTYIELRIESNHGNLMYTCLYRFRVHGRII